MGSTGRQRIRIDVSKGVPETMNHQREIWTIEPADDSGQPVRMSRLGRGLKNKDRDFDVAFWQAQTTQARMQAAWELVEHYLRQKGRESELRLQRSVTVLRRGRG